MGAAAGIAGRGRSRRGPFLPFAPEPHEEHRQRFMAVLAARDLRKIYGGEEGGAGVSFAVPAMADAILHVLVLLAYAAAGVYAATGLFRRRVVQKRCSWFKRFPTFFLGTWS